MWQDLQVNFTKNQKTLFLAQRKTLFLVLHSFKRSPIFPHSEVCIPPSRVPYSRQKAKRGRAESRLKGGSFLFFGQPCVKEPHLLRNRALHSHQKSHMYIHDTNTSKGSVVCLVFSHERASCLPKQNPQLKSRHKHSQNIY